MGIPTRESQCILTQGHQWVLNTGHSKHLIISVTSKMRGIHSAQEGRWGHFVIRDSGEVKLHAACFGKERRKRIHTKRLSRNKLNTGNHTGKRKRPHHFVVLSLPYENCSFRSLSLEDHHSEYTKYSQNQ